MTPGKAVGLFGEPLGTRSRRCPTSCIHAVVKGASNTVSRLKAAHITPSPFQREGGDGGALREHGHAHRHCTPTLALPPPRGTSEEHTAEHQTHLKLGGRLRVVPTK